MTPDDQRIMTPEYGALSLEADALAGVIDNYAGNCEIGRVVRAASWSLTRQYVVELESVALSLGVPPEDIEAVKAFAALVPELLQAQARLDAARARSQFGVN